MSAIISYKLVDGSIVEVAVTEEFAAEYAKLEHEQKQYYWREKKRRQKEVSLEWLMEMGYDFPDPVNRNPEEMYFERQEMILSVLGNLTEYQKRVAVKLYIEHKTHAQIAEEEGVSRQAVTKLLTKIRKKIISQFI